MKKYFVTSIFWLKHKVYKIFEVCKICIFFAVIEARRLELRPFKRFYIRRCELQRTPFNLAVRIFSSVKHSFILSGFLFFRKSLNKVQNLFLNPLSSVRISWKIQLRQKFFPMLFILKPSIFISLKKPNLIRHLKIELLQVLNCYQYNW